MSHQEKTLPGIPLYCHQPYGASEYLHNKGNGTNAFRAPRFAQPNVLKANDILANGDMVLSEPREGGNGSVLLHLTGGLKGHWVGVPARIPIALLTPDDEEYDALKESAVSHAREIRERAET